MSIAALDFFALADVGGVCTTFIVAASSEASPPPPEKSTLSDRGPPAANITWLAQSKSGKSGNSSGGWAAANEGDSRRGLGRVGQS